MLVDQTQSFCSEGRRITLTIAFIFILKLYLFQE